ncbi:MAG: hypothetical protein KBC96_14385 [Armatimonadetes bacterium]|nr:hypothetical protein [Armatimonadota bacterium]
MAKDYVPSNDQVFDTWLLNFVTVLGVNKALVGLVADDLVPIEDAQGDFNAKYGTHVQQKQLARGATAAKINSRTDAEAVLRPLVKRIQNHPGMTDQLRTLLGLPTPAIIAMAAVPITELIPKIFLETVVGQVTVHWGPEPGNEMINGKPAGVKGANIYRTRAGEDAPTMIGYATRSPYYDDITGDGAEYTYFVRYRGTKQIDLSPPSDEATVAARGMLNAA